MLQRLSGSGRERNGGTGSLLLRRGVRPEAERCGADRIELCAAPQEGGLTPSYGVLVSAREAITLRCIRSRSPARGGDFCYTEEEFAAMLNDIRMVRDLGFPGLVTGVLDADGRSISRG